MLDHLVYGTPDVSAATEDLADRLGVRAVLGGRHDGAGTYNTLAGLGSGSYLEIIGPDPDQPEPAGPRPFGVDTLDRPRLIGWALRCNDIDSTIADARAAGYDPGPAMAMSRTRPDGVTLAWRLTLNARAGDVIPFLIDWGETEHPSRTTPTGLQLVALHIEHPDPESIRPILAALGSNVDVQHGPAKAVVATIDGPNGRVELR
jgi:hypothetical protein